MASGLRISSLIQSTLESPLENMFYSMIGNTTVEPCTASELDAEAVT
jgi:hypothetical protein